VDDGRNAEPCTFDQEPLDRVSEARGFLGVEVTRTAQTCHLTQPFGEQRHRAFLVQVGPIGELKHPGAAELGNLLLEGHPCKQVPDPLVDGTRLVSIDWAPF
jgi:hypothetical protein